MIIPPLCRAGRALVGLSQTQLADLAGVSLQTVAWFEIGKRNPVYATRRALEDALAVSGVAFVPEDGGGPGVRLRDSLSPVAEARKVIRGKRKKMRSA